MEEEEPFSREYYEHLLSSLTINSRYLIAELTNKAEKYSDNAKEISELVEHKLQKALPQHKLNVLYLLDSICKNVGNPYNILFGSKLFKLFTVTYVVVTDSATRQHLINLFKTWPGARSTSGSSLFQPEEMQKIEDFIIKAAGISQKQIYNSITPEMLLREGNYLLQYIIMLMNNEEKLQQDFELDESAKDFIKKSSVSKNQYVTTINQISERIIQEPKLFDKNVERYHLDLQNIRQLLDKQNFRQRELFDKFLLNIKVTIHLEPQQKFFNLKSSIHDEAELLEKVKSFGKIAKDIPRVEQVRPQENAKETDEQPTELSASLGMDFGPSFSFLGVEDQREVTPEHPSKRMKLAPRVSDVAVGADTNDDRKVEATNETNETNETRSVIPLEVETETNSDSNTDSKVESNAKPDSNIGINNDVNEYFYLNKEMLTSGNHDLEDSTNDY